MEKKEKTLKLYGRTKIMSRQSKFLEIRAKLETSHLPTSNLTLALVITRYIYMGI